MAIRYLDIRSRARNELLDITAQVREIVRQSGVQEGVCQLFVLHTTAAMTINEGADPSVQSDILRFLAQTIPVDWGFAHGEGNSDAHIKASLVGPAEMLLVSSGDLVLGTWQAIYLCEFDGPRTRRVAVRVA